MSIGAKVLVAMSGGVDSSVAAAMLVRAGYEVVGCFMRLGSPGETLDELRPFEEAEGECDPRSIRIGHQGCCSIQDASDARMVAAELGIPFYVCNFKKDFGRIIEYFVDEYAAGRTPNPCVRCNDWLKFGKLRDYATQIDAAAVASGHYARLDSGGGRGRRLLRAVDHSKDQSYVLFGAPLPALEHMILPIGDFEKPAIRDMARRWGLPVFDKPDSQEICFVPDNDYAGLVEKRRPEQARHGSILDESGVELGRHAGQHKFTIGQRKGLGVASAQPLFVLSKDPATNSVVVGDKSRLAVTSCTAEEANWLIDEPPCGERHEVLAKYRYNSEPVEAWVERLATASGQTHSGRTGRFRVMFAEPQSAVAPGQAIVLYARDEPVVLGGGWISSTERAAPVRA